MIGTRCSGTNPSGDVPFTPTRPPAENTAEKQRVRQQMLARNWHDDAEAAATGSKLVKRPAESGEFVRWKSRKNSEGNS